MLSRGRKIALTAAVSTLASALVLCGPTLVANAEPTAVAQPAQGVDTVAEAKAELDRLDADAGRLEESYKQSKLALDASQKRAAALAADVAAQETKVGALHARAADIARAAFQSSGIDTTTALFVSGDPDSFLQEISTVSKVGENMNTALQQYQAEQVTLADLRRAADAEVAKATESEKKMADLTDQSKQNVQAATVVLNRLNDRERAALVVTGPAAGATGAGATATGAGATGAGATAADTGVSTSTTAPSGAAAQAVAYALAHVGSSYVWGAEGPNSFDCSGLMLAAYRSAGISLPHSSAAQSGVGRPVSRADLQPGDLIFWYSPIHHVAIYVGNGQMVHATNPRVGVIKNAVSQWLGWNVPYSGARRIAG